MIRSTHAWLLPVLAAACAVSPRSGLAQSTAEGPYLVAPGTRVRITAPEQRLMGAVGTVIDTVGGLTVDFSVHGVRDLAPVSPAGIEVSVAQRGHGLLGALVGGAVGLAVGYVASRDLDDDDPTCFGVLGCEPGRTALEKEKTALRLGTVGGLFLGYLAGKSLKTDRWVGLGSQEMSLVVDHSASTSGLSLGLAVRPRRR